MSRRCPDQGQRSVVSPGESTSGNRWVDVLQASPRHVLGPCRAVPVSQLKARRWIGEPARGNRGSPRHRPLGCWLCRGDRSVDVLLACPRHVLGPCRTVPVAQLEAPGRIGVPASRYRGNRRQRRSPLNAGARPSGRWDTRPGHMFSPRRPVPVAQLKVPHGIGVPPSGDRGNQRNRGLRCLLSFTSETGCLSFGLGSLPTKLLVVGPAFQWLREDVIGRLHLECVLVRSAHVGMGSLHRKFPVALDRRRVGVDRHAEHLVQRAWMPVSTPHLTGRAVDETPGTTLGRLAEVAELTGAHDALDRRAGL